MYNEQLCTQVMEGSIFIKNTEPEKTKELLNHIYPVQEKLMDCLAPYYGQCNNHPKEWADYYEEKNPHLPVSDFYLVENICNDCKGEIKDGICFCNRDEPKLLVEKEEGKEETGIAENAAAQNYAVNKTHPFNKLFTKLTDAFIAGVEWQKTIKS